MFEQIGRRADPEARKRDAMSAAITSLLGGAVVGFAMGLAAWQLGAVPDVFEVDDTMVEVVLNVPETPLTAPAAPATARAPAISKGTAPPQAEPDVDAEPTSLPEVVPDTLANTEVVGDPDGTDLGDPDGEIDGTHDTFGGGDCENPPCGRPPPTVLHHSELSWKRQVKPLYPSDIDEAPERVACIATVGIDAKGVPQSVRVADCPVAFQESARRAMLRSRWYSPRAGGQRVAAQTTIRIVFLKGQGD